MSLYPRSIYPKPLAPGDHVRVIAPSDSLAVVDQGETGAYVTELATRRLEELGLRVSFGRHVYECDHFGTSPITSRAMDLNDAFEDPTVNGIFSVKGGTNSQEILSEIDFDLVARNPKFFCGYSDITAVQNSIYSQTGLVCYSGPHWSTFGMRDHSHITRNAFQQAAFTMDDIEWTPSTWFTDDDWFTQQDNRMTEHTDGWWVIQEGTAKGIAIGSNLTTFSLLSGTDYLPLLQGNVLFAEVTKTYGAIEFRRRLFSVLEQPGGNSLSALVIGRFQKDSHITRMDIEGIVAALPQLEGIPIIANADFGHTNPQLTFPIGGDVEIACQGDHASIRFPRG